MQGREEEALEVLEYVNDLDRDDPNIITEFDDVKQTVIEMSKGSYRSLFEMTEYREFHRVVLAYVNQMFQQISGINLITYDILFAQSSEYTLTMNIGITPPHSTQESVSDKTTTPSFLLHATAPSTSWHHSSPSSSSRRSAAVLSCSLVLRA
jgi:hypothetical protein